MAHFSTEQIRSVTRAERDRERHWLYKTDHPRRIDRYIDFFGTGRARPDGPTAGAALLVLRSLA
jgi:hypothetical protein